jgi:outer membrane protein TolC
MMTRFVVAAALFLSPVLLGAQVARVDTIQLPALQRAAEQQDPRARELALLNAQSRLRRQNIDAELRPSIATEGSATFQSDVVRFPITLPGNPLVPVPPRDQYDAHLTATQRVYDPSITPRKAVEGAQLTESRSRLRTSLYALRQNVNDLYFSALRMQTQGEEIAASVADLEAQLQAAAIRVREGTALPSEELILQAELLKRRQSIGELRSSRAATLRVLADLTGVSLDTTSVIVAPRVGEVLDSLRTSLVTRRDRPEFEQFAATRSTLSAEESLKSALDRPHVSLFGRLGYAKPGLNALSTSFDDYWIYGLQMQWNPSIWGSTTRERETLALQRDVVNAEEQSFAAALRRSVTNDLATIDRLVQTLATDEEIIALRERVAAETRIRFREGVVTGAEYVDRETDVLSARIARAGHRADLAQSRARVLTTMGIEVR